MLKYIHKCVFHTLLFYLYFHIKNIYFNSIKFLVGNNQDHSDIIMYATKAAPVSPVATSIFSTSSTFINYFIF